MLALSCDKAISFNSIEKVKKDVRHPKIGALKN
jgi:hypothetical protein